MKNPFFLLLKMLNVEKLYKTLWKRKLCIINIQPIEASYVIKTEYLWFIFSQKSANIQKF